MASTVEQIKERLGIVEVVGSYLQLEKSGANFKAKCPFHNEKTPSFYVSPARNSYYCFGCGAKGDVLNFVQQFEGLDFTGALRVLAKRAGIEIVRESSTVRTERERQYLLLEHATLFFQKKLGDNVAARDYLKKRGITAETARGWRLGYAPLEWRALSSYLTAKGFSEQEIEKSGLAKKSDKPGSSQQGIYDRFRGRIMFPVFDSSGRVVAFSGRQFESDGTEAKYINSPETPLFQKSKILYGYDRAKLEIRRQDFALLVEGQMDLVMSHQAGFANTVATSGTALTAEQLEIIRRLSRNLVIAYDGDAAGGAAAARGWRLALSAGLDVKIAVLPPGKDPAELVLDDKPAYDKAIKTAKHIVDVELDRIMTNISDDRERGRTIERTLLPYVADVESPIEQAHFIGVISERAGIKEELLRQVVRKVADRSLKPDDAHIESSAIQAHNRREMIERLLWGIVLWLEKQPKPLASPVDIRKKMGTILGESGLNESLSTHEGFADELIFEAETLYDSSEQLGKQVDELLFNLEDEHTRERLSSCMRELQKAERDKSTEKVHDLLRQCQELSTKLQHFNQKRGYNQK